MGKNKKNTFKAAVEGTHSVSDAFQPGIQALEQRHKQALTDVHGALGSLALDDALTKKGLHPNANRWDYGIGFHHSNKTEAVLWLEPHHAAGGETATVLRKLAWLKEWLRTEAPSLNKLPRAYVWLVSNKERNPNDRRRRTLEAEKHGLRRVYPTVSLATLVAQCSFNG